MRIDPKGTIAGYSSFEIRELMRRLDHEWTPRYVAEVMHFSVQEAEALVHQLEIEGYGERVSESENVWRTTIQGSRLRNATAAQPIKRSTADRILAELIERVHEVNRNEYFLYEVDRLVVFGSYLADSERINDIDLAVSLEPKEKDPDYRIELDQKRADEAAEDGRRFQNFVQRLGCARTEVLMYLKSRSRAISLHEAWELTELNVRGETLFSRD